MMLEFANTPLGFFTAARLQFQMPTFSFHHGYFSYFIHQAKWWQPFKLNFVACAFHCTTHWFHLFLTDLKRLTFFSFTWLKKLPFILRAVDSSSQISSHWYSFQLWYRRFLVIPEVYGQPLLCFIFIIIIFTLDDITPGRISIDDFSFRFLWKLPFSISFRPITFDSKWSTLIRSTLLAYIWWFLQLRRLHAYNGRQYIIWRRYLGMEK